MTHIEDNIRSIIETELKGLGRADLFRSPLVAFSSAHDPRYRELKDIIGEWHLLPTEILSDANSVISCFVPFTGEVVRSPKLSQQPSPLWGEAYMVINEAFSHIGRAVCTYLNRQGFSAAPTPATHNFDPVTMRSPWSHRSAAVIAGLGTLGLNHMMITQKGSGGRVCTVFTSARVAASSPPPPVACLYTKNGSCKRCVDACPAKAVQTHALDKQQCYAKTRENGRILRQEADLTDAGVCGRCVSVCPYAFIP